MARPAGARAPCPIVLWGHSPGAAASSGIDDQLAVHTGGTVGLLAQDVCMPDVPRGLFDHVDIDPAQRHLAQPPLGHGVIQSEPRGRLPRLLTGAPVFPGQRLDRLVFAELPAVAAAAGIGGRSLLRAVRPARAETSPAPPRSCV